ncbi:phosphatidylglycerol lysyltransferase domain-containing protein [Mycobacterium sp. NPDC050441]|uniref:bifunctional lysylphosphatidylglycerol flippase/synthetase MprF n=1 Tax=Mycobacterium sp. NPDC050441 TaxID=3155403 RepID=UPI0033D70AFB
MIRTFGQHWETIDVTPSPAPASRPPTGVTADAVGVDTHRRLRLHFLRAVVVLTLAGSTTALVVDHGTGRIGHESALMSLLAVSLAATVLLHGLLLGRPMTVAHGATAAAAVLLGAFAVVIGHPADGWICLVLAAAMLVRPRGSTAQPDALAAVSSLVNETTGDPLAPFAMAAGKSYVFSADGTAALAYRALAGLAVVSGDPIGNRARYPEVVATFAGLCRARGWRIVVLAASERRLILWRDRAVIGGRLRAIPIGRDVVVEVNGFDLVGRRMRNLRQAVQRTRNAGVATEVVAESDIDGALRAELLDVMRQSGKAVGSERGFSMMLGGTLSGRYPGVWLIYARDRDGRLQAFQRYASAGGGTELSLDLPWRRSGAPNGIDERLAVDMITWAQAHGGERVSLAFAPFPDLFGGGRRDEVTVRALRTLAHVGDRLIKLESLYRYVRKFDALAERRYVLLPLVDVVPAAAALLTLELAPHRPTQLTSAFR